MLCQLVTQLYRWFSGTCYGVRKQKFAIWRFQHEEKWPETMHLFENSIEILVSITTENSHQFDGHEWLWTEAIVHACRTQFITIVISWWLLHCEMSVPRDEIGVWFSLIGREVWFMLTKHNIQPLQWKIVSIWLDERKLDVLTIESLTKAGTHTHAHTNTTWDNAAFVLHWLPVTSHSVFEYWN